VACANAAIRSDAGAIVDELLPCEDVKTIDIPLVIS
jgi:hypothetical protein